MRLLSLALLIRTRRFPDASRIISNHHPHARKQLFPHSITGSYLKSTVQSVIQRRFAPRLVQVTLQLPSAVPVLDARLDASFLGDPRLQPPELPHKSQVLRLQPQHGAEVIPTITHVDDPIKRVSPAVPLQERIELFALAHVCAAADLASVLFFGRRKHTALQDERTGIVERCRVGDDLVEERFELVVTKDGIDVDRVAVGEQEEGGLTSGFEVGDTALDTRMEGKRLQGGADVVWGGTLLMELDQKRCAQIGELLALLASLQLGTKMWAENFVDVSIRVLINQRPVCSRSRAKPRLTT